MFFSVTLILSSTHQGEARSSQADLDGGFAIFEMIVFVHHRSPGSRKCGAHAKIVTPIHSSRYMKWPENHLESSGRQVKNRTTGTLQDHKVALSWAEAEKS
jgi:hypothetical protein